MDKGRIIKVAGPLVVAENIKNAKMFDVVEVGEQRLIGEIVELRENKAAIQVYEEIVKKYAQTSAAPEALLGEARCQEILGNIKGAVEIYQTLISRYPLSAQAAVGEAKLQGFSRKKVDKTS